MTSALDGESGGQRHVLAALYLPGERTPGTHWTGGWLGPIAGLATGKEATGKILFPLPTMVLHSSFIHSQALIVQGGPLVSLFWVS
jgi:hypothetical protein